MKTSFRQLRPFSRQAQNGMALVEFAFVVTILFALLLGIMEFGRLFFMWNSAVEATRRGARLAIVCDVNSVAVKNSMRKILPTINVNDISVAYFPPSCSGAANCQSVTVEISPNAASFNFYIPHWVDKVDVGKFNLIGDWEVGYSFNMPKFSTTLTRESLSSGSGADANPDCSP
ncbi:TadE/TadG family type IV pilus assembly protein [Vogesella indigofera]|uniref:TadE/TadG family type IV pilus assembly protein n=1 Tax=Vogesella indigofera TaxID=45465 RepID=UPI00234F8411|nr:TadE family protein [Vogesella indigofera]MDC7706769.1 pilus assembly protein [Vogesella indigofera]